MNPEKMLGHLTEEETKQFCIAALNNLTEESFYEVMKQIPKDWVIEAGEWAAQEAKQ